MSDEHNTPKPKSGTPPSASKYFETEKEILAYWKKEKIFETSLFENENRPQWNFLDGPPFVTGMPHYGHIIGSILKDVFPRFKTMQGYKVRRVWGWDCHGLPAENKVENALGLKSKKEIEEKVGVKKFITECKKYVNEVSSEWEWYVDHIGRWVDFTHAYRTMDTSYMESVMWVFKQMYDKGYVYKGLRVSLFCPHCSTPISNFEVAMDANENYKEVKEPSNTYKYRVKIPNSKFQIPSESKIPNSIETKNQLGTRNSPVPIISGELGTYFLAWSTTPWTKLTTTALAVNPDLVYVTVEHGGERYILAQTTLEQVFKPLGVDVNTLKIIERKTGSELAGMEYEGHYDFYKKENNKKLHVIVADDFVTADEGTGIVTIAPYGEEDLKVMTRDDIQIVLNVDDEGHLTSDNPNGWAGMFYLKANKYINENLASRGLMFHENPDHAHTVAFCWRCHERLIYKPQEAWYVDVQKLKPTMSKTNEDVNWYPSHFKHGRFAKSMEGAPDWCISRSRYWGSPVPVWECECGQRFVPGSIRELEEASGQKVVDLHKPEIDEVFVNCKKCGKKAKRVPEVLDSWIEAGSASFAERHYPFMANDKESLSSFSDSSGFPPNTSDVSGLPSRIKTTQALQEYLKTFFPPDFISEYTGQIRAWFYVLHVIAAAIFERPAFKNVLVSGVILGTDGRKMSKNYKNYPDPREVIEKYGGDALRLYLLGSPITKAEDIKISEAEYRDQLRLFVIPLLNIWNFVEMYAATDNFEFRISNFEIAQDKLEVLDKWLVSRLNSTIRDVTESLESYDTIDVVKQITKFVDDWSRWYLRRSRDRIGSGELTESGKTFYEVSLHVFEKFLRLVAPIVPFHSEYLYMKLSGDKKSIHLQKWPVQYDDLIHEDLENDIGIARKVCEMGHQIRKTNGQKVRTPLARLEIQIDEDASGIHDDTLSLILDELNVKNIIINSSVRYPSVEVIVTEQELQAEGKLRDLSREVQALRKEKGLGISQDISLKAPQDLIPFFEKLQKKLRIREIVQGDKVEIV